jgi:hypothetical protein
MGLLAAAIVGGVFVGVAGLVGLLIAKGNRDPGTEPAGTTSAGGSREPVRSSLSEKAQKWDHRALADYLIANGFPKLKVVTSKSDTYFILHRRMTEAEHRDTALLIKQGYFGTSVSDAVRVVDFGSPDDAREFLRSLGDDSVKRNWGWGKFVFVGDREDHVLLQKALR